jgi:hypothetical protein
MRYGRRHGVNLTFEVNYLRAIYDCDVCPAPIVPADKAIHPSCAHISALARRIRSAIEELLAPSVR